MGRPRFEERAGLDLPDDLRAWLPAQGSMELQRDQPGKTHDWHRHSLAEELLVLAGELSVFWVDGAQVSERRCPAGTLIALPAGAVHGSTAGTQGAIYVIRPQDGATAETTWLPPEDHPRR